MQRRKFTAAIFPILGVGAWANALARAAALTEGDAASGMRAALEQGAVAAVGSLGRVDGFLGNPRVRIPLPGALNDAARLLRATGLGKRVDALETAMNRAAEAAVPQARTLLVAAVKAMSLEDAKQILAGADDSVTRFFAGKTREPLSAEFLPIVARSTEKVSLAAKYNAVAGKAAGFGLLKKEDAHIDRYVTEKALDGLYRVIAEEERRIRANPAAAGSAILKKVFGSLK